MQKAHDASKNNFWKNLPSVETPITKDELNRIEVSTDEIDDRVVQFDTTKANQSDLLQTIKNVTFDSTTGIFTFTRWNNTSFILDTDLEKVVTNFNYDDDPTSAHYQCLILTLDSGEVKYIDMSALITQYEFTNTSTIAFTLGQDGKISANVVDGSITGAKLQPNYLADVTAQANAAAASATQAANSATISSDKALVSEGWAKGTQNGTPVTSESQYYHNNAEYFKNEAAAAAGGGVTSFNARNGAVIPMAGDYDISQIAPTSGAAVGQVPTVKNIGTAQDPVLKLQLDDPALGGHEIINESGTAVANRDNLQFTGSVQVTDDSTNDKTIVDVTRTCYYGVCTTGASQLYKTVNISGFKLVIGALICIKFQNGCNYWSDAYGSPIYININNTGSKTIGSLVWVDQGSHMAPLVPRINPGDFVLICWNGSAYDLLSVFQGSAVSYSLAVTANVGDTSVTLSHELIYPYRADSGVIIKVLSQNASGIPINIASVVTSREEGAYKGQAVVTFTEPLTISTKFRLQLEVAPTYW